ncbi:hypothetical protein Tco_0770910 [Tanacetum coccineum]|uniref:E-beta-farnesene synthase n=1 Tax=Tanacetum coccineum TaxID=301880 RepID=A0ABQ4ZDI9_9ASTR
MFVFFVNTPLQNTMAEQNVPNQPPTRTDEQIVPRSQWLTIGKSNLLFNAQKIQKNPIFQISVDILSNTNFFQAFTASANVPAIYLQQFWNTMKYNEKTGVYSCQVDEQWFDLSADLLRKALAITPVIPAQPFELPPSGNTVIDFVNELGYPEPVEIVSNIRVNYVYQPWRAILSLINQCLTGKTSGSDKPRHPVLQMLWGIVTQTNVDHAELLWEEFTQGIQTFFSHKASHKASLKNPKKKVTPLLIPYGRFSKVIIYYLASNNNIHRRPDSAVHHTGDDYILGNLKFVPRVMAASTIPVSAEENLGDPIDIRVDIIHPEPVAAVAFPAAAMVRTQAQHGEAIRGIQEHLLGVPIQEELTALRFRADITEQKSSCVLGLRTTRQSEDYSCLSKTPSGLRIVSNIRVNYVYQPWRAILSLINQCLTGKTSGSDKPRHPVLQMLWGIVTQTNVDHAELLWEEFTQGIQTFFSHKASHKTSLKNPKKKVTPLLIPYGRFTKVIIYYLASNYNIHRRPDSAVHHTGDDFILGNLKFVPKGESVEVFGMAIPDPLITETIQRSSYYPKYLEMVAENTKKTPRESASVQPATKHATPKKPTTTTPVKQSKPAPPPTKKPSKRKLPQKVRKGKPTFQLVDEDDEAQQESIPQEEEGEGDDADMERAIKLSLDPAFLPQGRAPVGGVTIRDPVSETTSKLHEVVGKGKAVVTEEQVAHSLIDLSKKKRTTDQFILVRRDQTPHDSTTGPSSQPEDDTSEKGDKDQDEVDTSTVTSGVSIPVSDPAKEHEALAGPDPEPMKEDQTGSDSGNLHTVTSTPPVIAPFTDVSSTKPSSLVTSPPINTEATTITTSLPEITPFIAIQLKFNQEILDEDAMDKELQTMLLPQLGWRALTHEMAGADISMHRSNPDSEHSEQSSDTFNLFQKRETLSTLTRMDLSPNDFPEPENNWQRTGKKKLCKANLEGPAFNLVKAFHKNSVFLQYQMDECHKLLTNTVDLYNLEGHQILRNVYEPLPLGGPPGQVTIQPQFFFNKDLDYLLTVPSLWVESEREYDISAVYGITHWWFRRKEFYINKHSEPSDREAVRSQMRILSVISVKVFEKYGYNYLREIILRRADYQEYKISEKDFRNLHPNDFEDLFLLNIQEKLNHLPKTDKTSLHTAVNMWIRNLVIRNRVGDLQLGIESYQTKINLERPNWDAADYYFKEDYTIVPKPRAVVYRDRNDQRKLMRLNELHKFSDGTLTRVMEKLDHMVKDFCLYEYNKGMETRKWSEDDKRRSKDFITAIEKRL